MVSGQSSGNLLICESGLAVSERASANMAQLQPLFPQIGLMCLTLCSRSVDRVECLNSDLIRDSLLLSPAFREFSSFSLPLRRSL